MSGRPFWLMSFAAAALAAVICVAGFILAGRGVRTPTTDTISTLATISADLDLWNAGDNAQCGALPTSATSSIAINRKLATLLKSCSDKDMHSAQFVGRDGLFRDRWGTPLFFMSTNDPSYERLNSELRRHSRPFATWSAGPNRTNDFGFGDDLHSNW